MVEWVDKKKSEKKWIRIESILSTISLHKNIWVPRKHRTLDLETHDATRNVFKIWDSIYRQKKMYIQFTINCTCRNTFIYPRERDAFW